MDRRIVRALQLNPRAPFSLLGPVLGMAEQTAARRLRRLVREGLLRVTAVVDPHALGQTTWTVRVRCRPEGATALAEALARRDDVSWVSIHSAGWEVTFNLRARSDADAQDLLVRLLPKTTPVLDVSAAAVLHTFIGGDPADWQGWIDTLTGDQTERLRPKSRPAAQDRVALTREDRLLLDLLAADGRASYAALARRTRSTSGRVRRRVEALAASGVLHFDVDLAPAASGAHAVTMLWLTVTPDALDAAGTALAGCGEIPYAAALTGPANLTAALAAESLDGVYQFLTDILAHIPGITGYDLAPQLRAVKQAGTLITDGHLTAPRRTR